MTEEEIEAIAARAKAANPGPWCSQFAYTQIRHVARNCDIICSKHDDTPQYMDCKTFGPNDGEFIAAARADVPALIAALREANAKIAAHKPW